MNSGNVAASTTEHAPLVIVRGAGDLATGVLARLHRCGWRVLALETVEPTVIRRSVAFAEAVRCGRCRVEELEAVRVESEKGMKAAWGSGLIPVAVDPSGQWIEALKPAAVVDAILAKRNLGTHMGMATVVVALGPGFTAGVDCHAVVETNRGHRLGSVIYQGAAQADTGIPGVIAGYGMERLLRSPADGLMECVKDIGDTVRAGDVVARVGGEPVTALIDGVVRGLLTPGYRAYKGMKIGDVDPRLDQEACDTISDKALSVAGGVLEALLLLGRNRYGLYERTASRR